MISTAAQRHTTRHRGTHPAVSGVAVRWTTASATVVLAVCHLAVSASFTLTDAEQGVRAALIAALVMGLPHGAADVDSGLIRGSSMTRWMAGMSSYAGLAVAVIALWLHWPAVVILLLLLVAALHFGVSDTSGMGRIRTPRRGYAAVAFGLIPVSVPIALHGSSIVDLLDALSGQHAVMVIAACRAGTLLAVVAAMIHVSAAARRRDGLSCYETLAMLGVFALLPPLPAFAIYYASWHCARQVLPTVTEISERHGLTMGRAANRYLLRTALPSLAVLVSGAILLTHLRIPVTTLAIVIVLSLTVPHSITAALQSRRPATRPSRKEC